MNANLTISRSYVCFDNYTKIICRVYDLHDGLEEWKLCKTHSKDPDFDGFISETKIKEVIKK